MLHRYLNLLVLCGFLFSFNVSGFGQTAAPHEDAFLTDSALTDGIELAARKKFDQARTKFSKMLAFWQTYHTAALYVQIADDVKDKRFNKKAAGKLFKAIRFSRNSQGKKGLKEIAKLIKKNKTYFPLLLVQAEIFAALDDVEHATAAYARAVDVSHRNALCFLFRGKFQSTNYEPDMAIADFSLAVQADSNLADAYFERGFALSLQGHYDEAIQDFKQATRIYPAWGQSRIITETYFNRAVRSSEKKSYRSAIKDFTRAIQNDPSYLDSYLNRGMAYRNVKQYGKAVADFDHCIASNAKFKEAYYNRGLIRYDRKKYGKAAVDFQAAADLDSRDKRILFKLAETYYQNEKYDQAIVQFDKVIALDGDYYWAYYWKAFSAEYSQKPRQAAAAFQSFLARAPKQYYKQITHAEVELKKLKKYIR